MGYIGWCCGMSSNRPPVTWTSNIARAGWNIVPGRKNMITQSLDAAYSLRIGISSEYPSIILISVFSSPEDKSAAGLGTRSYLQYANYAPKIRKQPSPVSINSDYPSIILIRHSDLCDWIRAAWRQKCMPTVCKLCIQDPEAAVIGVLIVHWSSSGFLDCSIASLQHILHHNR